MQQQSCPLEEGDHVDHQKFGFGTVSGPPKGGSSDPRRPGGTTWSVPVLWDDPDRTAAAVVSTFLRKVSSPDTRPFTYWDRQWRPLVEAWLKARRAVEAAAATFRPLPDAAVMSRLARDEAVARQAMEAFVEDEREGRHS